MTRLAIFPMKPSGSSPGFVKAKQPVNEHEAVRSSVVCAQNLPG